jgi:hypothetical protein
MWLLFADGVAYLAYGLFSGHFRRDLPPPAIGPVFDDIGWISLIECPASLSAKICRVVSSRC